MENGSKVYGFSLDYFEEAVLSLLKEIDPREVLGDAPGQNEIIALSIELENVRTQQDAIATELAMLGGESKTLAKAAALLDTREKELTEQLDQARAKSAHPAGECWGEAMSLIDALEAAPDPREARLKLRALLRQLVNEIWILVVPVSKAKRLAAVQVFFESGARRDYLIHSQDAGYCRKGGWTARSLPPEVTANLQLDLRRKNHAERLEKVLMKMEL
jgi:hypothetical protein